MFFDVGKIVQICQLKKKKAAGKDFRVFKGHTGERLSQPTLATIYICTN